MNISDLQFAFFFANPPVNLKFDEFSVSLRKKSVFTDNNFDLETFILPIPSDVPAEFPRCQITSKDKKFHLQVSGERCDVRFNCELENSKNLFNKIITQIIQIFETSNVDIIRFGYVTRYIVKHENPDLVIREKFLKIREEELHEPLIRFLFKVEVDEDIYNDVYQIETAQHKNFSTGSLDNIVVITHDFNTLPEDTKILRSTQLNEFINNIPQKNIQEYISILSS